MLDLLFCTLGLLAAAAPQGLAADLNATLASPLAIAPGPTSQLGTGVLIASLAGTIRHFDPLTRTLTPVLSVGVAANAAPIALTHASLGDRAVFVNLINELGREPWVTDGTAAGTQPLADLMPGPAASDPRDLTVVGSLLFFSALTPGAGRELCVTDGTPAGTRLVLDLWPGATSSTPRTFAAVGGVLLFVADEPGHGSELWRSDGTAAGTWRVVEFTPGSASTLIGRLGTFGGVAIFSIVDAVGNAIAVSDGTAAGSSVLTRFSFAGLPISQAFAATPFGLMFALGEREVWFSDGTAAGTRRLYSSFDQYVILGGGIHGAFIAVRPAGGPTDIYVVTAATAAPQLVTTMAGGVDAVGTTATGTVLYRSNGRQLWRTDGTLAGTYGLSLLGRALEGTAVGSYAHGLLLEVDVLGDGKELWWADGTSNGTVPFARLDGLTTRTSNPLFQARVGERALVTAFGAQRDLYAVDVTGAVALTSSSSGVAEFAVLDDRVLFTGSSVTHGGELWVSDGTVAGTHLLVDLLPGAASASPLSYVVAAGTAWFMARSSGTALILHSTDGTAAGTHARVDLGATLGLTPRLAATSAGLFVLAADAPSSASLWLTDGSAAGTTRLLQFRESQQTLLTTAGDRAIFSVYDTTWGRELWSSDGTVVGTARLADIAPGVASSDPSIVGVAGPWLLFSATDPQNGRELWRTDGTPAGTNLVADLAGGAASSDPTLIGITGDRVFFAAATPSTGRELFVSDGTAAGTRLVHDAFPGPIGSAPSGIALGISGEVAMVTQTVAGHRLWITDGANVRALADLPPFTSVPTPSMLRVGNRLYFAATDPVVGMEPWVIELGTGLAHRFGRGCSTRATLPRHGCEGRPTLGSSSFASRVDDAAPLAPAALLLGAVRADVALGACRWLVPAPLIVLPAATDASGHARAPLPIPASTDLVGGVVFGQWLIARGGGPFLGVGDASDGLEIVLGR